jgi:hypothetical protein
MAQFFQVKVQFTTEDSKGKVKKQNILYLVDAMSVTEAEAKVVGEFESAGITVDYEVSAARESKIIQVIESKKK